MFKQSIIVMVTVLSSLPTAAQSSSLLLIDRLKSIASVPFWYTPLDYADPRWKTYHFNRPVPLNGVDSNYANLVKRGKKIIPTLIKYLNDSTLTDVPNQCDSGYITVGQLTYFIINDIEFIPVPLVTNVQWDMMSKCEVLRAGFLEYLQKKGKRFEALYRKYFYSQRRLQYLKANSYNYQNAANSVFYKRRL